MKALMKNIPKCCYRY